METDIKVVELLTSSEIAGFEDAEVSCGEGGGFCGRGYV